MSVQQSLPLSVGATTVYHNSDSAGATFFVTMMQTFRASREPATEPLATRTSAALLQLCNGDYMLTLRSSM